MKYSGGSSTPTTSKKYFIAQRNHSYYVAGVLNPLGILKLQSFL